MVAEGGYGALQRMRSTSSADLVFSQFLGLSLEIAQRLSTGSVPLKERSKKPILSERCGYRRRAANTKRIRSRAGRRLPRRTGRTGVPRLRRQAVRHANRTGRHLPRPVPPARPPASFWGHQPGQKNGLPAACLPGAEFRNPATCTRSPNAPAMTVLTVAPFDKQALP